MKSVITTNFKNGMQYRYVLGAEYVSLYRNDGSPGVRLALSKKLGEVIAARMDASNRGPSARLTKITPKNIFTWHPDGSVFRWNKVTATGTVVNQSRHRADLIRSFINRQSNVGVTG